jgi:hypothetical protein
MGWASRDRRNSIAGMVVLNERTTKRNVVRMCQNELSINGYIILSSQPFDVKL